MRKSTSRTAAKVQWKKVTTIGIDIGDRFSQCCGIDERGEVIVEIRVATKVAAFELEFKALKPKTIAIETGTHSPWMSRLLSSFGHRVIVANSRKLRLIYENRKKDQTSTPRPGDCGARLGSRELLTMEFPVDRRSDCSARRDGPQHAPELANRSSTTSPNGSQVTTLDAVGNYASRKQWLGRHAGLDSGWPSHGSRAGPSRASVLTRGNLQSTRRGSAGRAGLTRAPRQERSHAGANIPSASGRCQMNLRGVEFSWR